jgi:hypothetical protein
MNQFGEFYEFTEKSSAESSIGIKAQSTHPQDSDQQKRREDEVEQKNRH